MKQLSGMDAGFIHLERNNNKLQIGSLLIYDVSTAKNSSVDFEDILQTFVNRVAKNSLLRKKIQRVPFNLDHPYWVNDSGFDIKHHLRHIALPKPGNWRALCDLVARLHAHPLDFNKPLWEAYVIEGLDNIAQVPKGSFAIYIKVHHAAVDGIAGNELVTRIHDLEPFPKASKTKADPDTPLIDDSLSTSEMLTNASSNLIKRSRRIFDLAQTALPAWERIKQAKEEQLYTPLGASEPTRFNKYISGNLVMDAAIFDFEQMRQIKNALPDVTVNDVMLAIVSGAMQKYLASKNETPTKNLSAGMPVNIRPFIDNLSDQDSSNLISAAKVNLNNTIEDPLKRLAAIHKSATESKVYQHALGPETILEVGRALPASLASLVSKAAPSLMVRENAIINTIITNVPGPQTPLYMGGAKLISMCNIGIIIEGLGIFHAVSSYCDTATVSFHSCHEMMPDPEFYKECIEEAFNELKDATKKSKKTPAAKKKARAKPKAKAKSKVKAKPKAKATS